MKKIVEWGISAVIFLLPWQTVWIIQERLIGPEGAMGVWQYGTLKIYAIEFLIAAIFILFVFNRWSSRCVPLSGLRKRSAVGILAFLLFSGLSIVWSADKLVALFAWVRLLESAFLFYLIRSFPIRWTLVFGAWIAAAFIQSILGIWQFTMQEVVAQKFFGIAQHNPLTLGDAVVEAGDRRWLRAYGAFPHPNMLGAYLAISLILCAKAFSYVKEKWQWLILILSSQVLLIGLLLTFSRSAWIALGIVAICYIVYRLTAVGMFLRAASAGREHGSGEAGSRPRTEANVRRNIRCTQEGISLPAGPVNQSGHMIHPFIVMALVSVVTAGIFTSFFSEEIVTRFGYSSSRLEQQSISERVGGIQRAIPLLKERLYFGTGIGNFTNTLFLYEQTHSNPQPWYTYQPLHNVFLMIFVELGLSGLLLFLLLLFFIFRRVPRTGWPLLAALFVLSFFDHFLWTHPIGIFFAAIILGVSTKVWYTN